MLNGISSLLAHLKNLLVQEEGQDLVEYALIVALIALAAVGAMQTLAGDIGTAFTTIGGMISGDV